MPTTTCVEENIRTVRALATYISGDASES